MVEGLSHIENEGQLLSYLDQVATKLATIDKQLQSVSKQEMNDLINVLQHINETLVSTFWKDKKLSLEEGMNQKIEQTLIAIQVFQQNHPEKDSSHQRNINQTIISLFSALNAALNMFDKNLRDLKKYKIGQKIEKTDESKHS